MAAPVLDALDPFRLPRAVRPQRYDVTLRPSLDTASFTGSVVIDVVVDVETDVLVLNAAELDIESCRVDGTDATFELDETQERLVVRPPAPVDASWWVRVGPRPAQSVRTRSPGPVRCGSASGRRAARPAPGC